MTISSSGPGLFLAFEGPDGGGKSTQARLLAAHLRGRGRVVVETREPGGTPVGEALRPIILDGPGPPMSPLTMTLLLSASRAQLVDDVVLPALAAGHVVIADRFADSTVAYQAHGLGVDIADVRELTRIATRGLRPHAVVFVDVPVEVGLQRATARGGGNRLDHADIAFHERVRNGYLELMTDEPGRWLYVDGSAGPDEVHAAILAALAPIIGEVGAAP
jgi:dTMP kinase